MSSTKTIGIIGGGQLGQMMAISAIYMGHKVITLDPAADCPSSRVSEVIVAPYDDVDALRQLADRCDVLTYEFENVDADGLDAVIKDGQLPQGTDLLRISQNRIFEKDFLSNKAKVTVAPYKVVTSSLDLEDIDLSKKYVLKQRQVVTMVMVKKSSHQPTIWKRQMPLLTQPSVSWKSSSTSTLKFQSSCLVTARM